MCCKQAEIRESNCTPVNCEVSRGLRIGLPLPRAPATPRLQFRLSWASRRTTSEASRHPSQARCGSCHSRAAPMKIHQYRSSP